jgi:NAD(P)-dependent dehydrogenase (short-subunit alcohol dehydrogenase family)
MRIKLFSCDLLDRSSVESACTQIKQMCPQWDVLVLAPGNLEPIGNFRDVDFDAWEDGIQINLLRQLRIVHRLLPNRNVHAGQEPAVLFFAGGGTNNAVLNYSSYTLSKIALIKMCELLDAEILDTRFLIVGPGCVKTKIHEPTLRLGEQAAGQNYQRTVERLQNNECTPMEAVVEFCHWLITTPSQGVRGRNFSVVADPWHSERLLQELEADPHMYKLRRHKNSWMPEPS